MEFNSSPESTIGVELELQLLDPVTLGFSPKASEVLQAAGEEYDGRIKKEFLRSMIEVNTRICRTVEEAEHDLRSTLSYLEQFLESLGMIFLSTSLHPFERGSVNNVIDDPRYGRIMKDLQLVGRRFITQGLHVHIGVSSPERAVKINNLMRMYLPLLLALSTSSPYYMGEDTGLNSYRTKLFEALPLAGLPDSLESWEEFRHMAELLVVGGIIESVRDLWWDVRPHPDFGTVETRVCDIPVRLEDTMAITALVQSLVSTISNLHLHPETRVQMQILRANKWQAARYGLDGVFLNPVTAKRAPIRDSIADLLEFVRPEAERLGAVQYLEGIKKILKRGTGADLMRRLYAEKGDFNEVIRRVGDEFYKTD